MNVDGADGTGICRETGPGTAETESGHRPNDGSHIHAARQTSTTHTDRGERVSNTKQHGQDRVEKVRNGETE